MKQKPKTRQTKDKYGPALLKKAGITGTILVGIIILCIMLTLLFPEPVLNRYLRTKIENAFAGNFPGYSLRISGIRYNVFRNRIGFDSVDLSAPDSSFLCSFHSVSAVRVNWLKLLWEKRHPQEAFLGAAASMEGITISLLKSQYRLSCSDIYISIPDSTITIRKLEFHPSVDEEVFFAASRYRRSRFRLIIPELKIAGIRFSEIYGGNTYSAQSIHVYNAYLNVLLNKDKPGNPALPLMPEDIFRSIEDTINISSIKVINSRLKYGERFAVRAKPGILSFDKIYAGVSGFSNHAHNKRTTITARTVFMKEGAMEVNMVLPLTSRDISLKYSGSLGQMNLSNLNPFLDVAEQLHIDSGQLEKADFDIQLHSGRADGYVNALYRDLYIKSIDKDTKSSSGIKHKVANFILNSLKLRGTNLPHNSDKPKIGKVSYTRQQDDTFIKIIWLSVRSGIGDIVGF